jgi:predicted short-subunit dehydrogenase-like oxidoreductase (DUF2520 family)
VATLHPICSLRARGGLGLRGLERAAFGLEGDPAACDFARALIGAQPVVDLSGLEASGRIAYHAACALVGNHLAVLVAAARDTWGGLGIPTVPGEQALLELMSSALDNLRVLGLVEGTSGPAARGDEEAVKAHLAALQGDVAALYAQLSQRLARIMRP